MIDDPAIEVLRRQIDAIDHRLMGLLEERLKIVHAVGEVKREKALPVFDPTREELILRKLVTDAPEGFDEEAIRAIFLAIVSHCRRLEEKALEREQNET